MYRRKMKTLGGKIRAIRLARGLTQTEFAEALGTTQSTVTRWEAGSVPSGKMLQAIAALAETTVERLMGAGDLGPDSGNTIPVVGFVGAGAGVFPYDDYPKGGGLDHVDRPPFIKGQVVAVEVRGDSLLPVAEDGWRLVYAGEQSLIEEEILNRLCVVKLEDGRSMVKRVLKGSETGRFHLISTNAPMIADVRLEWAAPVKAIIPS